MFSTAVFLNGKATRRGGVSRDLTMCGLRGGERYADAGGVVLVGVECIEGGGEVCCAVAGADEELCGSVCAAKGFA